MTSEEFTELVIESVSEADMHELEPGSDERIGYALAFILKGVVGERAAVRLWELVTGITFDDMPARLNDIQKAKFKRQFGITVEDALTAVKQMNAPKLTAVR